MNRTGWQAVDGLISGGLERAGSFTVPVLVEENKMELVRVDTQRAYQLIRDRITTLDLAPGSPVNEQSLAQDLDMGESPVREALKLLAHDKLIVITPRHGLYVADVNIPDLEQLSEMRLALESFSARLAAERATSDDLVVLDSLRREQAAAASADSRLLLDIDHKFHQTVARAAQNKYLIDSLEGLFGLSQRLWYLALPQLDFLSSSVEKHLDLVEAIRARDAGLAERIMQLHVKDFYAKVREVLIAKN
jgi:DNA-binding GntR family transcriptional regulator